MKRKKNQLVEVELELTKKNDELLRKTARKCGLKPDEVLNQRLGCEVDIAYYAMTRRLKLFRRLKIEPTVERLLGFRIKKPTRNR